MFETGSAPTPAKLREMFLAEIAKDRDRDPESAMFAALAVEFAYSIVSMLERMTVAAEAQATKLTEIAKIQGARMPAIDKEMHQG